MKKIIVFFNNSSATTSMGAVKVNCDEDLIGDAEATAELFFVSQGVHVSLVIDSETDPAGMLIDDGKKINWDTATMIPVNQNAIETLNEMHIKKHSIGNFIERFNRNIKYFCNIGCSVEYHIKPIEIPKDINGIAAVENAVQLSLAKGWFVPTELPELINELKLSLKETV